MVNWRAFLAELLAHFGPANAIRDAERSLESLSMSEKHKIETFDSSFMRYALLTSWNDSSLTHRYRSGLPDRIKDSLLYYPPYEDLNTLRDYASTIDHRYWERADEKRRDGHRPGTNPGSGSGNGDGDNGNGGGNNGNRRKGRHQRTPGSQQPGSGSGAASTSTTPNNNNNNAGSNRNRNRNPGSGTPSGDSADKPWSKYLGKDGKLKPEVKAQRLKDGCCLFCGKKGHFGTDCPLKKEARARAATAAAAASSTPAATPAPSKESSTPSAPPAKN
jgi:hypothetical protein